MDLEIRFMERVSPEPTSGCWLWTGEFHSKGYGRIVVEGARLRAHRVAWELARGPIPAGLHVLHRCDNRACVNAWGGHLFLGTNLDNVEDAVAKGRFGEPARQRQLRDRELLGGRTWT